MSGIRGIFSRDTALGQLVLFGIFGLIGAATNFFVYYVSLAIGVNYLIASFLGWFIGLIPVFFLNRRHTFRSDGSLLGDFGRTVLVYLTQQLVMAASLAVCVEAFELSPLISYFVALPIAVATSFLGVKFYAMRNRNVGGA